MDQLFTNYISKQNNKLKNMSNILNYNNKLNSNSMYFQDLLKFNLKGLNIYNKILKLYISKYNNLNLISDIKNNPLNKFDSINSIVPSNLFTITNKSNEFNSKYNESIIQEKQNYNNNLNINKTYNNILKINEYLNSITINNNTFINKNYQYIQYIGYNYNNTNNKFIKKIYDFLFYSFFSMNSLISKPVFEILNDKIIIHLLFYLFKENNKKDKNNNFIKINNIKLKIICKILSQLFKKPVELDLVKIHYPYFDSNIFANLLSILINKIQIRIIMQNFFKKAIIIDPIKFNKNNLIFKIPSFLSGIKLRIGGRLMTQRIVPKQTIKIFRKGTLAKGKINFLDEARYTNKNKKGAFTVTISIGHYFN